MKSIAIVLLSILELGVWAQNSKYVSIPGTRVQMTVPAGYMVAETFFGLQKDRTTGIQIFELKDRPYSEIAVGFTKNELQTKGAEVYDFREMSVAGYSARYACLPGDSGFKVSTLIFGDSTFSVMMVGAYPAGNLALQKQVEQALTTAKYNNTAAIDPFALSYFKLDDTDSKYKYAKTTGDNMYIYSLNGEVKDNYMSEAAVTATPLVLDSGKTAESVGNILLEDMKKYGLTETVVTYKSLKKVNGFDAYEAIIYGQVAKQKHAVYHLVVSKASRGFIVQGIAQQDFEINMQQFEKLAHTISVK